MRLLFRIVGIVRLLARYGLLKDAAPARPLRVPAWLLLARRRLKTESRGRRLREALQELGPIFVKFGQNISTRPDLLPRDIAGELARLQDDVPPFPAEQAREALGGFYGRPVEEVFADFEPEALAAASIAQVHAARLPGGEEVVVKLLRPGIRERIARDVELLFGLARLAEAWWPATHRLRLTEAVEEYQRTLGHELDLTREGANASRLKRSFAGSEIIHVPAVYWDYCRPGVLVMERIHGTPIRDVRALKDASVNIPELAARGVEIFFTQVFRDSFFHADMHPGNVFVDISDPKNPRYAAVDFGIVGILDERDHHYLGQTLLAFFEQDYARLARLHLYWGWVAPDTRAEDLEAAFRVIGEPIFARPLSECSFAAVLGRIFATAREFDMHLQPQMLLLHKTLLNIEGLGRELYPELDLWETGYPLLKKWMARRAEPGRVMKELRRDLPELRYAVQRLPRALHALLDRAEGAPSPRRASRPQGRRRLWRHLTGCTLLLAGALLLGLQARPQLLSWLAAAAGLILIVSARPRD